LVAPVGLVGIDEVAAEDFAGGEVGDQDLVIVGEREDTFAGVFVSGCITTVLAGARRAGFDSVRRAR
jgi:hypothetical protein